jgi:ubiquinol-cytochrome c reductase cytochrome b subunit|uniref:Cytochrome b n=1 Tax=Emiliania huxleyi TaxID=2903 RepID=Q6VEE7_EMIHU|nr:apocytochrome b [Emiliania huxleyi]UPY85230.1 apocytochrome b [Gephyrocapsa ericsonii]UPY85251.1 apocytochrome b [Gephyrocapsa parvula]AAP94705.1 apocytochrome b [Emiliania huxleyi]AEI29457.1 apocytochrome b [Emiliania huxleyi]UPY84858.1 apocytochrome b [Emiliania huxleyi]
MIISLKKNSIVQLINAHLIDYPTPSNISYWWNFGFLAGMCLGIQIVTGIALAMHYTPHVDLAFLSLENIMRDVNGGWLLRYLHANGASMFFIVVYIHIGRGLYYGSYAEPRGLVWILGTVILLLMMATAFMGYVLPWGQMSFWGATVITNLFSAFPIVGSKIVTLLWGGFSVDNATLNRFFSLHYLMPFVIAAFALIHIAAVHENGSNNPLGISSVNDKIGFFPYFVLKDSLSFVAFIMFFSFFVYFYPNDLGHPDNYIPGNPMVTPEHIVPEWYFLPSYAILRSIPNKLLGVLALLASILILLILPVVNSSAIRSTLYRPIHQTFFWFLVFDFILLGYIGQQTPETPFIEIGQIASVYYFAYFLVIIPTLGYLEKSLLKV